MDIGQKAIMYCKQQIKLIQQRERELRQDERGDEADFEKVRINVYQICCTYVDSGKTLQNQDWTLKIYRLKEIWQRDYENALAHDEGKSTHIGRLRLEVLDEFLYFLDQEEASYERT